LKTKARLQAIIFCAPKKWRIFTALRYVLSDGVDELFTNWSKKLQLRVTKKEPMQGSEIGD